MLTIYDSDTLIEEICRAGVHGRLSEAMPSRDLVRAIETLLQKKGFYPPGVTTITHRRSKTHD